MMSTHSDFDSLDGLEQTCLLATLHQLRSGPMTMRQLAAKTGRPIPDIRAVLSKMPDVSRPEGDPRTASTLWCISDAGVWLLGEKGNLPPIPINFCEPICQNGAQDSEKIGSQHVQIGSQPIRQNGAQDSEKIGSHICPNRFALSKESSDSAPDDVLAFLKDPLLLFNSVRLCEKTHIGDRRELALLLLGCVGSLLPHPYRVSFKISGDTSAGKDSLARSVLTHLPAGMAHLTTQSSDKFFQRQLDTLPQVIYFSEFNLRRRGGANENIVELLKALLEDGMSYGYLDRTPRGTFQAVTQRAERRTCVYSSTDIGGDEELLNRLFCLSVKGGPVQTRQVIEAVARKHSDIDALLVEVAGSGEESPISKAIRCLQPVDAVQIPYFQTVSQFFDASRNEARRHAKKLLAVIAWSAFFHQAQRKIRSEDFQGRTYSVLVAQPIDFLIAATVLGDHLNQSYTGMEPRINRALDAIRKEADRQKLEWVPMQTVRQALDMKKTMAWQLFDELEALNLIETMPCADDRRAKQVRLSTKGRMPFLKEDPGMIFPVIAGADLSEPIQTYLRTYFSEEKSVSTDSIYIVNNKIGSLVLEGKESNNDPTI